MLKQDAEIGDVEISSF